jgi:tRNA G18 (ribose-2'-O)-methylase SpoU
MSEAGMSSAAELLAKSEAGRSHLAPTVPEGEPPLRLQRAESVLRGRTGRIRLVLEHCIDSHNHMAVLRTAEAMGIQSIWLVDPAPGSFKAPTRVKEGKQDKKVAISKKITKGCEAWMDVRHFATITACVAALREEEGLEIWATDLSAEAQVLSWANRPPVFPRKLAVVIGRESDGVSPEMLAAADRRIYLPMYGFTESFNLSVATALVVSRLMDWCPEARGDLEKEERDRVRGDWCNVGKLAKSAKVEASLREWLEPGKVDRIKPLADLRRPSGSNVAWVPPKIRKREAISGALTVRDAKKPNLGGGGGSGGGGGGGGGGGDGGGGGSSSSAAAAPAAPVAGAGGSAAAASS